MIATTIDKRTLVELDTSKLWNFEIPFQWMHKSYGRAEFQICVQWKRRRVEDLWIYPKQQERVPDEYWHAKINGRSNSVALTGYDGLDYPNVWYTFWCKEHKCQALELYVPSESRVLWISILSTLSIGFKKGK
jgi:hypothetical protein